MKRVAEYFRIALRLLTYGLAIGGTATILRIVLARMILRLGHLSPHYVIANDWLPCQNPQCDFSVFWSAGLLARMHDYATIYDPFAFLAFRQHLLYAGAQRLDWFYPPPTLLPMMAISYVPFEPAFFLWVFGLVLIVALLLRWAGLSWPVIVIASISPAALWNWELGQLGIITGGLLVAALLMADQTPKRAGALIGLLILKPQMALLTPVALLARRNWRAIAAAACVVVLILAVATLILGPSAWVAYWTVGREVSKQTLEDAVYPHSSKTFGVSFFWMMRSLGADVQLSYLVQTIGTVCAIAVAWLVWRSEAGRVDRMALLVFLSLLATPFGYVDYMVGYQIALVALAEQRGWKINLLDVLFWLWPALCPAVTDATGVLLTPVILILAIARTWQTSGLILPHMPRLKPVLPRAG